MDIGTSKENPALVKMPRFYHPIFNSILVLFCTLSMITGGLSKPAKNGSGGKGASAFERAASAFRAGNFEEALNSLDVAEKNNPNKPEIPNLRGLIFSKKKQYDEAEREFNQALVLDPKFYAAKLNLADLDLFRGDYPEAKQQYADLRKLDPDSELLQFKEVLCAVLGGESASALAIVIGMRFPGKTPAYYYCRAAIALKAGQKETAQKYFVNAKKYYSEDQCAYFAQSLLDVGLTMQTAPSATPGPSPSPSPVGSPSPTPAS
jgi:Tfp pilus assembly protein PilF